MLQASMKPKLRIPGPWLFGLAIFALAALAVHWTVLIYRHESGGISAKEHRLHAAASRHADRLGRHVVEPKPGRLATDPDLEIVRIAPGPPPSGTARIAPRWPGYGVRPTSAAVKELRDKRRRRQLMITGEGSLALLLFIICVAMLWRMLVGERQRRREIEAFVSTVSHELKTPLAGIKALLRTLEMGYIPPERLQEFLEMGLRETDRLEHLVENLLIADRIRQSTLAVQLGPVPLEPFLVEYLAHRNDVLPADHPGVELTGDPLEGVAVQADGDKLRVVLENLTDNALKYGEQSPVRIAVRATAERVRLAVEDDGIGFDPDHAEELFTGLRAAALEQGTMVHGTGLGLGIARDLSEAMGGTLTAESDGQGKGSRFTITLPRAEAST